MRIVFIADMFAEEALGGSELSLQAHIDNCPYNYIKIKSDEFKFNKLRDDDFIIFGNYAHLLPLSVLKDFKKYAYVIIESDYKYCRFRSSHLHKLNNQVGCDCPDTYSAPIIDFMLGAKYLFWKSEGQRNEYYRLFPELKSKESVIISGVFTDKQIDFILSLKDIPHDERYFILKSNRWIKGYRESVAYCVKNNIPYREVDKLPYEDTLKEIAKSKGIVYLPSGYDTACRMITEAKLMGREVITTDRVQHTKEAWFNSGTEGMVDFLKGRNRLFWEIIDGYILKPA